MSSSVFGDRVARTNMRLTTRSRTVRNGTDTEKCDRPWSRRHVRAPGPGNAILLACLVGACSQSLDAGSSRSHGRLPVDERNPIVLFNDNFDDNWQGVYAMLLANNGGPKLAGIVVNASTYWPDLESNATGWKELVAAARATGLRDIPDPITSTGAPLVRPADGSIEATVPNRSEGARFIVEASARLSQSYRPLVVVTGGGLTDVADAFLIDPTVADRIVVLSSLGALNQGGGAMIAPNGDLDPWACTIVASRLPYIQISAFYNQTEDVPAARVPELPATPLGSWIAAKQARIWATPIASDQVGVIALGVHSYVEAVERVAPAGPSAAGATVGPDLVRNPDGPGWLVTKSSSAEATAKLWELLRRHGSADGGL